MERTKTAIASLSGRLRFHWREVLFALVLTVVAMVALIAASFGAARNADTAGAAVLAHRYGNTR